MDDKQGSSEGDVKFERRKHKRINGTYIVSYALMKGDELKFDVSQTRNLSEGGLAFICDRKFEKDDMLKIKLRLPEFSDYVILKAQIVGSDKLGRGTMYATRVKFVELAEEVKEGIRRLVEDGK
ncbi:MAG: PilZ domain-containing protein [Candidatus Omnitrophota bacterium]|jgi:hypothetical protein